VKLTRRETLGLAAATAAASFAGLPGTAFAADGDQVDIGKLMAPAGIADHFIGSADAPVTMIEYASPTCIHCAQFSNNVLGPFIEQYVDTGKVRLIIRPFARNNLDAAIFMLAEHVARNTAESEGETAASSEEPSSEEPSGEEPAAEGTPAASDAAGRAYEAVLTAFFRSRDSWIESSDPLTAIRAVAAQFGFTDAAFEAALTNQEYFQALTPVREQAVNEFGLTGTPTFYINGKQMTGDASLERLATTIDPLL
jgi:protein-disulfide isomerase